MGGGAFFHQNCALFANPCQNVPNQPAFGYGLNDSCPVRFCDFLLVSSAVNCKFDSDQV